MSEEAKTITVPVETWIQLVRERDALKKKLEELTPRSKAEQRRKKALSPES